MDLLMALEPQAKDAGGRAFALLGNHEVMNLIGETRDVTREIFATFADANSEKRRQDAWEDYAKLAAQKKEKGEPVPSVYAQTREAWLTTHPLGFRRIQGSVRRRAASTAPGCAASRSSPRSPATSSCTPASRRTTRRRRSTTSTTRSATRSSGWISFVDRLIDLKLATRDFTLQEILQVASGEIGLANARIAAAKAEGKEPDRGKLNVPLLMEAQEILKIDSWLSINPEGALWYRGLATVPDDPAGRTVCRAAAEVRREAVRHRPHAAAEPLDHRPLRRPRGADRYRNADERLQGPRVGAGDRRRQADGVSTKTARV